MKNQTLKLVVALSAMCTSVVTYAANTLDMNFSDDSVRVRYGQDISSSPQGRKEAGIGALYNNHDNAMIDAWFQITDEAGSKAPGLDAGVGPKLYFGKTKTQEYFAFAIGGLLLYRPLQYNRMLLLAEGYFAPNIVTFLDADNLWEINLRVGYEILPSAVAYISYRQIRANFDIAENEQIVDRGAQVGLELKF